MALHSVSPATATECLPALIDAHSLCIRSAYLAGDLPTGPGLWCPENHRDTTMSMRAAQTLSIPELLQALSEKLEEEHSTMREMPLSSALPAGSLEPEVRSSCPVGHIYGVANLTVNVEPLDQESRNPSARYPQLPTQPAE